MSPAGYALREAGVSIGRVAEEAGVLSTTVSTALAGHQRMTENTQRAIRRLLSRDDADRVIALAAEARETRSG